MRRIIISTFAGLVALSALIGGYIGFQMLTGNMHEVLPGELYRSAQPTAADLARYQKEYGIKSVINLRGENEGSPWYDEEIAATNQLGLTHYNFRMKSSRELSQEQALALIDLMKNAPKPLLIHCRAGADRTGLASAVYFAAIAGKNEWESERQLWLSYGHVPRVGASVAMNRTFEKLEPIFGFEGS